MWNKLVFGSLAAAMITACGPSVSEVPPKKTPQAPTSQPTTTMTGSHPVFRQGVLPETPPSADVAALQKRVVIDLKKGFLPSAFDGLESPDETIFRMSGNSGAQKWAMNGERRVGHLVIRHIEVVTETPAVPNGFCQSGNVYSAYVAGRPFVREEFHSTAMRVTTVFPYGLFICENGGEIKYKLVSARTGIFATGTE